MNKKVSFVCTTYRRFNCVERIIAQYYAQTYSNKELIIFNTDVEHPLSLRYIDSNIKIINNDKSFITDKPYTNRGDILNDAIVYASGDYFLLADDDDIYMPWHLQQAVDGIEENGKDAWKPEMSLFATTTKIELVKNTLEASVIVKMNRIREIGFRNDLTGYEGLSWYIKLRDEGELDENNKDFIPSYCFNWSDTQEMAGHKQSGDIDSPDNFENHKRESKDYAKRPLMLLFYEDLTKVYYKYYKWFKEHKDELNQAYYNRYIKKFIK